MDNLLNPNVAIPHYSPLLSPLPHPPPMQKLRTYILMSLINIFAVAILLISSICWCRFSYVPFRKRKRVETMDCFWICCDDADNVLSVNKINLGTQNTGGKVTWHTNKRTSGTWWCCTGEDDGLTYLFVEFVAGKGWYKRHVLQEVGPQLFKLMPVDHQFYVDVF